MRFYLCTTIKWELTEFDCKWVFRTKRETNGKVEKYKARLVVKDYNQWESIDYTETLPVFTKDSFRIVIALIAQLYLEIHQIGVKTTFLIGDLIEDVYMLQLDGFFGREHLVCKLNKFI